MDDAFLQEMSRGYTFDEPSMLLGGPILDGEVAASAPVRLPLSMVNRHGLVAGATGTGKTKTLQILAGQLSDSGVPVFVSDVKGDLTGISQAGDATAGPVVERVRQLGISYEPVPTPSSCCRCRARWGLGCGRRSPRSARSCSARCST